MNSANWCLDDRYTDVFVKAEKTNSSQTEEFVFFYKKDSSLLVYSKIGGFMSSNGMSDNITPDAVVKKYSELKSSFTIDSHPENFNYSKKSKKNNNYTKKSTPKKNVSYRRNDSDDDNDYNRSNHSNDYRNNDNNDNRSNHSNHSRRSSKHEEAHSEKEESNKSYSMRNGENDRIGRVRKDGDILNESGDRIGRFNGNEVLNKSGERVARFDGDEILNASGERVLRMDGNYVLNKSGEIIGKIEDDGVVRNADGDRIGDAGGMDKGKAAYNFFIIIKIQI